MSRYAVALKEPARYVPSSNKFILDWPRRSGKTTYLINKMIEHFLQDPYGGHFYFIVPREQMEPNVTSNVVWTCRESRLGKHARGFRDRIHVISATHMVHHRFFFFRELQAVFLDEIDLFDHIPQQLEEIFAIKHSLK